MNSIFVCNGVEALSARRLSMRTEPACVRGMSSATIVPGQINALRLVRGSWGDKYDSRKQLTPEKSTRFTALVHIFVPMSTDCNLGDLSSIRYEIWKV